MKDTFDTIVAGVTHKNPNEVSIQSILKKYVKENYDTDRFDKDDYDYWTNKEIQDFEFEVNQYELYETGTITLVPNPDNPYDPNAIMVLHKDMGMIGYIPRSDNVNLAKFLNNDFDNIQVDMELESGPYKYYDLEADKVKKKNNPYYLRLYIKPSINDVRTPEDNQIIKTTESNTKEQIAENKQDYDIFELLALTHLNKKSTDIANKNRTPQKKITKQADEHNLSGKDYKNPLIYLTCGIVALVLSILLIIRKKYILAIISIVLLILFTNIYIETRNKNND